MKHFMLFIREDLDALKNMTEEEMQEDINTMIQWVEALSRSGNYVSGDPLEPEIRVARKEGILTDGPFIETKEALSGYLIIQAENIEQAAQIAQACPLIGRNVKSLEIRPIQKF
ncbi:YciI family protein [Chryseosolibacter indicus]|uniref:YCII-related domain-containing protein n=1 Tax=Chryseosolibacter indicus TaxID=2782351 RepID=A0ABS5VR63_9BACT|nr:YciI family protein [Chryseosolibacter indicus]MBT1703836.1 hypothetical protein [Chryseosolibacter indicus]